MRFSLVEAMYSSVDGNAYPLLYYYMYRLSTPTMYYYVMARVKLVQVSAPILPLLQARLRSSQVELGTALVLVGDYGPDPVNTT